MRWDGKLAKSRIRTSLWGTGEATGQPIAVATDRAQSQELWGGKPRGSQEDSRMKIRQLPRHFTVVPVTIYDVSNPEVKGLVRDITKQGVGVERIASSVYETKTLVISVDGYDRVAPFGFQAECRWVQHDHRIGHYIAGFEMTRISDRSLTELLKLIRELTFSLADEGDPSQRVDIIQRPWVSG
jgi:hypothetical protein